MRNRLGLDEEDADLLRRGAYLYEIGLAISHSSYHRHSAYLLENSDIDGFSQVDKTRLSQLVMHHRRKLKPDSYDEVKMVGGDNLVYLTLILRLAVLVHHSRSKHDTLPIQLAAKDDHTCEVSVNLADDNASLVLSAWQDDIDLWQKWGMRLSITIYEPAIG